MGSSTKSVMSRRMLLRESAFSGVATAQAPAFRSGQARADSSLVYCNESRPQTPADALQALIAGNERWATFAQRHPGEDQTRRECVFKNGQSPFATIISCSDSRVPPEMIFDQGIGDLFVARVAGNGAIGTLAESLYYGTSHLCTGLLFVLGHSECGAVKAAVESFPAVHDLEFVRLIKPAIELARQIVGPPYPEKAVIQETTKQNVMLGVKALRKSPFFKPTVDNGTLLIAGGVYDLKKYKVTVVIE
jgi:carbonic anhydrase